MKIRDAFPTSVVFGAAVFLLLFEAAEGYGERVVNANEPVVILDDITKRVTTVESRSFPPRTPQSEATPDAEQADVPGGSPEAVGRSDEEPVTGEEIDWPWLPTTSEPPAERPAVPRRTPPAAPGRVGDTTNTVRPSDTGAESGRDAAGRTSDAGVSSPTGGSSSDSGAGTSGIPTTTRPAPAKAEVTVTTEEGNVGSVEIEEVDPNSLAPGIEIEP
jgi:hypothetical protein